uniref:protein-serine/threonine phosphatase n=1 Tax=Araucaria cunninghamii TaxID=56994 RepID=A0A0D6QXN3_ARACU
MSRRGSMQKHMARRRRREEVRLCKAEDGVDAVKKINGRYENFQSNDGNSKVCSPGHGCVSICGRRREMEDATAVVPSFAGDGGALHFFAVYDGHGGARAALLCKERLHRLVAAELGGASVVFDQAAWRRAAAASFSRMDAEVCEINNNSNTNNKSDRGGERAEAVPGTSGTTAVVAVVGRNEIAVANCGDSRAVLSRGGVAMPLTLDHKPERADEAARIEAAGGRVIFWNGYRVFGVLATSRAIGDRYLKPYVISEPEVTFVSRFPEDECLILASDGLWDVVSNETACEIAHRCLAGQSRLRRNLEGLLPVAEEEKSPAVMAAALLTKLAVARGSSDNISVVVVDLRENYNH